MADSGPVGRDGANRELKNRLQAVLSRQGLSQADIVRQTQLNGETVSKAALSNALNPEKGPPAATTLKAVLSAAGISGTERAELSRLRDRAAHHGTTQLDAYLEAAGKAARQHPYPSALGVPNLPALADVYVRQRARTTAADTQDCPDPGDAAAGRNQTSPAIPAAEVFRADHGMCLLLGGPGGGKSTLLRAALIDAADGWAGGQTTKAMPVRVTAVALTGDDPLPTALARSVTGDLRDFGLLDELGTDFFRRPPLAKVPWLVLVDGLDEIPDADTRSTLLTMLAGVAEAAPEVYRFVIATRPLPESDLGALGQHVPRYGLQPFTPDDLLTYATHWFQILDDPGRHAEEFIAQLRRTRLDILARTPLMAFMLCQLFAADPARPLPDGRTGAYQSFIRLIYEQNAHKNIKETHDKAIRRMRDRHQIPADNQAAEQAALQVRDNLPKLIDHLAHERISGTKAAATEIVAAHLRASRPHMVQEHRWHSFLADLLRPTGILTQRADDFDFLHQTLLEYHAARHATRSSQARTDLLLQLFTSVGGGREQCLDIDPSYLGFLLDRLLGPQDTLATRTIEHLEEFTTRGGRLARSLLMVQVELATGLPPDSTARQLTRFACDPAANDAGRIVAAEALTRVEGHRSEGAALLASLARDRTAQHYYREEAAEALTRVEGHRSEGAALLASLARDPAVGEHARIVAAEALSRVYGHREEGAALLASLARDPTIHGYAARQTAADTLARMGKEGAALLASLVLSPTVGYGAGVAAAEAFNLMGEEGAALLATFSRNPAVDGYLRIVTAATLAGMEGHRKAGAALLALLARDPAVDAHARREAAMKLAGLGGHRTEGAALLASLARNPAGETDSGIT